MDPDNAFSVLLHVLLQQCTRGVPAARHFCSSTNVYGISVRRFLLRSKVNTMLYVVAIYGQRFTYIYILLTCIHSGILLAFNFFKNTQEMEQFKKASAPVFIKLYTLKLINRYLR